MGSATPKYGFPYPDSGDDAETWKYWHGLADKLEAALSATDHNAGQAFYAASTAAYLNTYVVANNTWTSLGSMSLPVAPVRRYLYCHAEVNIANNVRPGNVWTAECQILLNGNVVGDMISQWLLNCSSTTLAGYGVAIVEANQPATASVQMYPQNGNSLHADNFSVLGMHAFPIGA